MTVSDSLSAANIEQVTENLQLGSGQACIEHNCLEYKHPRRSRRGYSQ